MMMPRSVGPASSTAACISAPPHFGLPDFGGRAVAFAMPPDYELVRPKHDMSAAEMLAALLGTDVEESE